MATTNTDWKQCALVHGAGGAYTTSGENLRDGLKAAGGLAVVWLVIVLAFELPALSHPILWSVFGFIELLMLGTALSELKWLPDFLRAGDQELAMSILENDWDRARRRQEEIGEEIERRIAQGT